MNWGQKLVTSGADGASVNLGKKAGLAALLRKELSFLVDFHCLPYRLELALLEVQKSCKSDDDVYKLLFPSKVFPCPSLRSFSDQLRMRKRTEFRLEKEAKFPAVLN